MLGSVRVWGIFSGLTITSRVGAMTTSRDPLVGEGTVTSLLLLVEDGTVTSLLLLVVEDGTVTSLLLLVEDGTVTSLPVVVVGISKSHVELLGYFSAYSRGLKFRSCFKPCSPRR